MEPEIKHERLFWSAMGDSEVSATFGPFATAEEAESHSRRLGWRWVSVWNRKSDEFGTVLDLTKRFYEVTDHGFGLHQTEVDELRNKMVPAKEAAGAYGSPLNEDETAFFASYEKQLSESTTFACAECGEDIADDDLYDVRNEHMDGTVEILHFHKDFKKCCPFKWSAKRLAEAAAKLEAFSTNMKAVVAELRRAK